MSIIKLKTSGCPWHIGHELFTKKIIEGGNLVVIELQGSNYTKQKLNLLLDGQSGYSNEAIKKRISVIEEQNNFLDYSERKKILYNFASKNNKINIGEENIPKGKIEGNAVGSDIFMKLLKGLNNGTKRSIEILSNKKLYICEREGYSLDFDYEKIVKDHGYNDIEIINLGKSPFDITGTEIRKQYKKLGVKGIKQYVSKDVYNILRTKLDY